MVTTNILIMSESVDYTRGVQYIDCFEIPRLALVESSGGPKDTTIAREGLAKLIVRVLTVADVVTNHIFQVLFQLSQLSTVSGN